MAVCEYCNGEMNRVDGCTAVPIKLKGGKELQPIPYGSETSNYYDSHNPEHCHDCNARLGQYHHRGCDWEECPNCEGQLFGCDCVEYEEEGSPN